MKTILYLLGVDFSPIQTIESVKFDLVWGGAALILLWLVVLPLFFFLYRFEDKPCSPGLAKVLLLLRMIFAAGILALLAGPRLQVSGMVPQKNKIPVLIDSSISMSIREEGKTRMERVQEVLGPGKLLQKIEEKTGIPPSVYSFSGQVSPLSKEEVSSFSIVPEGTHTDITRALSEVSSNLGVGNLLGIVLLTDGAHNRGDNPLEVAASLKVPLFFLGTGKMGEAKDLSIALERPPSIGFLNSKLRIRGEIRAFRIASESITVEVKRDGKPFDTIPVVLSKKESRTAFNLNIPCDTEGIFNFSVSVPRFDQELTFDNNETGFLLKVVKERLKILALVGSPNWDISFIRGAARSDGNVHFNSFVQVGENRWLFSENYVLKGLQTSLDLSSQIDETDVLILQEISESFLRPYFEPLKKRLESGKMGILILPGNTGYSALGYPGSPLAEFFPVELAGEKWRGNPCNMSLTSRDVPYAFLKLQDDPMENQEFFRALPKLDGIFLYPSLKGGAEVLLSSNLETTTSAAPVLIYHRVGRGNVAMLTGGPIWPMGFKLVPTGKGIKPFTAFVLNMLKWLANRREDAQVVLEMSSARAFVGQPLNIRVWVSDSRRQPVDSAQVGGTVSMKDSEPVRLTFVATAEKGAYETSFAPARKGKAEIQVDAHLQGQHLGEARGQLLVEMPTIEFDQPEVRFDLMNQLASISNGICVPAENFPEILKKIEPKPGQKREVKILDVRDNGLLLVFLLFLPILEWILRRTKGFS